MKYLVIVMFFGVVSPSICQENPDCSRFKFGKFEIDNLDGTTSIIERKGKFQTEISDGLEITDKVEWIDECNYMLIPNKEKKKDVNIVEGVLYFTILETLEHAYIVRVTDKKTFEDNAKLYEYGYLNYDIKEN